MLFERQRRLFVMANHGVLWTTAQKYFVRARRYDGARMKPLPPPDVPGATDAERMKNAVHQMFSVSKEAFLKEEARLKRSREKKRAKGKDTH